MLLALEGAVRPCVLAALWAAARAGTLNAGRGVSKASRRARRRVQRLGRAPRLVRRLMHGSTARACCRFESCERAHAPRQPGHCRLNTAGGWHGACAWVGMTRTDNKPLFRNRSAARVALIGARARSLRASVTSSEALLWERLRGRRLGVVFRRQVPPCSYRCVCSKAQIHRLESNQGPAPFAQAFSLAPPRRAHRSRLSRPCGSSYCKSPSRQRPAMSSRPSQAPIQARCRPTSIRIRRCLVSFSCFCHVK